MRFQKKNLVFGCLLCVSLYLTGCESTQALPDTYDHFEQTYSVQNADGRLAGQTVPGTVSGESESGLDVSANISVAEFDFSTSGDDTRLTLPGIVTLNMTSGEAELDHDAQTEQSCSFAAYLTEAISNESLDTQLADTEGSSVCSAYETAQLFAAGLQYDWFLDAASADVDSNNQTEGGMTMLAKLPYEDAQTGLCEALYYRDADENYYISVFLGAPDEETLQEQISALLD